MKHFKTLERCVIAFVVAASLASCATRVEISAADAFSLLPDEPLRMKAEGAAVAPFAGALLGPDGGELAKRTREAVVAIAGPDGATGQRAMWAVCTGDYPFDAISWQLSGDPAWKRDGAWFRHLASGLTIGFAGSGQLLACTGDVSAFGTARFLDPFGASPTLKARWEESEFAIAANRPFETLFPGLLEDPSIIPLEMLMLYAYPSARKAPGATAGGMLEAGSAYLFGDARSAAVFLPSAKLAWYGIAKTLFPDGQPREAFSMKFAIDGALATTAFIVEAERFYAGLSRVIPIRIR